MSKDELEALLTNFFLDAVERFILLDMDNSYIKSGINLILKRGIRTLDALQLSAAIELKEIVGAEQMVFVCSDKKLLRAAEEEGFVVENPENFD